MFILKLAFFVSPDRRGHPGAGSPIPDACAPPGDRSWPSLLRRLWLGWLRLRTAKPQPHSRARKRRRAPREGRRGVPALRAVDAHELRRHITPEAECRDLTRGEPNVLDDALRVFAECADRLVNVPRRDVSVLEKATEAVLTVQVHVPVAFGAERDPVGGGGRSPHGVSSEDVEVARVLAHGSPRYRVGRACAVDGDHARRKLAQPRPADFSAWASTR